MPIPKDRTVLQIRKILFLYFKPGLHAQRMFNFIAVVHGRCMFLGSEGSEAQSRLL